ncbi:hypothetical protein [Nocardiopsis sp. YSL2]|uniref:hypothetical protein n=1 Tax=Nocardiopsis sp. YSL2 TaxID=2939492 RepID=UPI0026F45D39|nr:hypothetical protein [Nocardiopsis sp. YSL2]
MAKMPIALVVVIVIVVMYYEPTALPLAVVALVKPTLSLAKDAVVAAVLDALKETVQGYVTGLARTVRGCRTCEG